MDTKTQHNFLGVYTTPLRPTQETDDKGKLEGQKMSHFFLVFQGQISPYRMLDVEDIKTACLACTDSS